MALVLWVRTSASDPALRHAPRDLLADGGSISVTASTPIACSEKGPFVPLGIAIERDGRLRDVLLSEIAIPSLRDHRRTRLAVLAASLGPMLMLLELDRELVFAKMASPGRFFVDFFVS